MSFGPPGAGRAGREHTRAFDGRDVQTRRLRFVASPHQGRTVTIEKSGDATAIRPFTIEIRQAEIAGLRARIAATRWPEKETVADQSQGVQLATIQELYQAPRSWAEQAYANLIYFNEVDKGNHFAAWQEPELFTTEVRAAFRSLR